MPKLSLVFWLGAIAGIIALFVAVIIGDLGNVLVLVLVLALILACFFLCGGSISPKSRGTTFLLVMVSLGLVRFSFLVLLCLLVGLVSLLGLVSLFLDLALKGRSGFVLSIFRLFIVGLFH